jgi:hypothetical protein
MTETMTYPRITADGRAIVIESDFEARAVVPPSATIESPLTDSPLEPDSLEALSRPMPIINEPAAGVAVVPAIALATRRPKAAKTAACSRGRLPNMPSASAHPASVVNNIHSTEVLVRCREPGAV